MDLERTVGLRPDGAVWLPERRAAVSSILLKLAAMGVRIPPGTGEEDVLHLARDLFARYREQTRLLSEHLCPADRRIQGFLDGSSPPRTSSEPVRLPERHVHPRPLRPGARAVAADRRRQPGTTIWSRATASTTACCTTPSTIAAPPRASSTSRRAACRFPPTSCACRSAPTCGCSTRRCVRPRSCCACRSRPTGTSRWRRWSRCCCGRWCARRCPKVSPEKRMEVRFFAPGGLVSNLDFVESIFGNAGDPFLPGTTPASTSITGPATPAA